MTEEERRNIKRLGEIMASVPQSQEAWRLADIVSDAVKIGEKGASKEYIQALDELVQLY
jgi:hypothetical protein